MLASTVRVNGRALASGGDLETVTTEIAEALVRGATVLLDPPGAGAGVLPPRVRESAAFRADGRVPLTLALHHGIGGVAIDAWGRTSLPGLYACGEAAGGVQGRRRTMGTGLLEATIFARRAARAARHDIGRTGPAPSTGEVLMPPLPDEPAVLEERLDQLMGPLVAMRPPEAVRCALHEIERWPLQAGKEIEEKGGLAALRRGAALAVLTGETARSGPE
jgi:L-aspartate oxidase